MTANATVSAVFRCRQRRAAARTVQRMMILDIVRRVGSAQGRALEPARTAAFPVRFAALALCLGLRQRLLQPVTRRRLAAVPTVPAKPALQLFKTLSPGRILGLKMGELLIFLWGVILA